MQFRYFNMDIQRDELGSVAALKHCMKVEARRPGDPRKINLVSQVDMYDSQVCWIYLYNTTVTTCELKRIMFIN